MLALLVTIVVMGAVLRTWHLRQPLIDAFSWRQASTAMIAENYFRTNPNILFPEVNWSGPGPNYQGREFQTVTYLASIGYRLVGQHDWIGRAIATAFGLWGIVALHLLVRRIASEEHALAAAAVLAILPGAVFIDRSFLPDPAMVALATTTLWLFVAWLQTGRSWLMLASGIVGAWAFATKIPGLIVGLPMAYAAYAILGWRELTRPRRLLQLAGVAAMILIPVAAWYLWARHLARSYPPYHFAGEGNWVWDAGLATWMREGYFLGRLRQHFMGWIWTAPLAALVVMGAIVGPYGARRTAAVAAGHATSAPFLFHWWAAACALFYLIGARELVDNPWNFHVASPAAAGLAGGGIVWLAERAGRLTSRHAGAVRVAVSVALVLAAVGVSRPRAMHMYMPYASQGLALGTGLERAARPGELVLTMASALGDPVAIYYARRRGWVFPPARNGKSWGELPRDDRESIALLDTLRHSGAKWLGVTADQMRVLAAHPLLLAHVRRVSGAPIVHRDYTIFPLRASGGEDGR